MARPDITAHIKANAQGFHVAMAQMRRDAKVTANSSGAAFAAMSDKLRGGVAGALAGLTVGAGIRSFMDQAREAVAQVEEIASAARTAGVGFEDFQELSYAARRNLVSVDALTDGIKEMQLRIDEVVRTGKGSAAESLGRLGYSADELAEKLKQPDQLFEDIIQRMKALDTAAQIRVSDEIFGGTAGEQFVRLLDEARGSIADNRREAQELGIVISEDLAGRVEELRPVWDSVATVISTRVKSVVLEIVALMGTALDRFNEITNQTAGTLELGQIEVDRERLEIENRILELREEQRQNTSVIAAAENRIIDGKIAGLQARHEELTAESAAIAQQISVLNQADENRRKRTEVTPPESDLGNSGGGRNKAADDADRQRKKILELIDALEHESRTLKMNETDQRVANELRKAGALATPEQTARIIELVQANEAERRSREEANREIERQQQIYEQFGGTLESTLEGVLTKTMSVEQALIKVGFAAIKAALDINRIGGGSGGGLGGLLSSVVSGLFGGVGGSRQASIAIQPGSVGLFAKGGISDKPAIFGEGPYAEAAVPLPDGRSIPVNLRGAGAGPITAPVSISIDATGADAEGLARVRRQLSELERDLPGMIVSTVRDGQRRRGLR